MTNYGFVIDNRRCIGCHACTVACKTEHDDPIGVNKTWVKYIEKGDYPNTNRNFSVMRCNHCDDSPCTDVCPVTALWEREDGIVDFDPDRCIGCKACMQGCPYDALYIDPETSTAAKCNYCSHRVDSGREPACVTVCPEDAIIAGDMENPNTDLSQTIADEEVQARKPEKGTEPKLYYVDGDEGSITPGSTGREEHYMWSDAPNQVETHGAAREDFDLQKAAESLAESDVSLNASDEESARADGGHAHSAGGCGCGGNCGCGGECSCGSDDQVASDGGYSTEANTGATSEKKNRTAKAYELLNEEARRVYDIGESHYESWGWEVYSYTMTKSISAGIFLLPALLMAFGLLEPDVTVMGVSSLLSAVFLGLTGVLLILDLEQPTRFHWVLLRPNWNSWLVKGAYIITAFGGFLGLMVLGWLLGASIVVNPIVLSIGSVLAAATAIYTAFLFSQSKGRDLWQSPAMPLHMLTQAIVAGAAATALLGLVGFEELVTPSQLVLAGGLVVHLALVASELFTPHQTEDAEEAAARIVRGRFATAFWAGGMALGIAVPLVALALSASPVVVALAGVATLVGLFAYEYCWITAPQTISLA
ncbi:4Fe-4S dicluster domain-containing protein [Natrinema gelatinilyticum]|uniref:4Fe-4S dicluster domain-containing protein n=1 Tax=Natrinema gelatinilyticum TaxID=2961571 RepID=UPI0020C2C6CD|nr:4Fe-4S dicluster domain-containing protein [Natrinema gelatinilyticum]